MTVPKVTTEQLQALVAEAELEELTCSCGSQSKVLRFCMYGTLQVQPINPKDDHVGELDVQSLILECLDCGADLRVSDETWIVLTDLPVGLTYKVDS